MHVGEGASSKALACKAPHSRKVYQGRVEQAMVVRPVAQGAVDPLVVRRE